MRVFRVGITGSRDWPLDQRPVIDNALDAVVQDARAAAVDALVVVHGDAIGADTFAHYWAIENRMAEGFLPVIEEVHRPAFHVIGKTAGYQRNRQMVNMGADLWLAFIKDDSPGSRMCLDLAIKARIQTRIWRLP